MVKVEPDFTFNWDGESNAVGEFNSSIKCFNCSLENIPDSNRISFDFLYNRIMTFLNYVGVVATCFEFKYSKTCIVADRRLGDITVCFSKDFLITRVISGSKAEKLTLPS